MFEDLGVGEAGISHVGVHGAGAIKTRSRASAAADGFVVLVASVAESEAVHGALGGGHDAKGAEEGVGDALGGFDVAGGDGGGVVGVEERSLGYADI